MAALVPAVVLATALFLALTAYLFHVTGGRVEGLGRRAVAGVALALLGAAGAAAGFAPAWLLVLAGSAIAPLFMLDRVAGSHSRLVDQTRFDALTDLLSRREGLEMGRLLLAQAYRNQFPVSAAVLDVDHFKRINDAFGHDAGDEALLGLVRLMRESLAVDAPLSRIGGEEFAVFFSHATEEQAAEAAWRILRGLRLRPVRTPYGEVPVTASVGVAQALRKEPVESLVERADQALYEAKRCGRDRVRSHSRLLLTAIGE